MIHPPRTRRAFTLIELLVVIAIIAILAAILFPVFAQAKQAAKKTASLSNLKQTATASQVYMGDSDDTYPLAFVNNYAGGPNGYNYGSFITTPPTLLAATEPAWKRAGVESFVFNSMQPYMKNVDLLKCPGGIRLATTATYGPTGGVPSTAQDITYTYNGILNGYNATAIAAPADLTVFWHGQGRRSLTGLGYASPWLNCDQNDAPCVYQPTSATCGTSTANGVTSGYTTRTGAGAGNKQGVNVFNGGVILAFADSHAKFRKLASPGASTQRTDPRIDPWARYDAGYSPRGRWWDQNFCHPYMFRPDYDFQTAQPATYVDGGADAL